MSFDLFPPLFNHKKSRTKSILTDFKNSLLHTKVATTPKELFIITSIFQKQLPKMPKEYIFRQVFDPKHKNLILHDNENIIGGICYRSFYELLFVEIVFCAVDSSLQIRGYGNFMMDCFKEHVKCEYWYNKVNKEEKNKKSNDELKNYKEFLKDECKKDKGIVKDECKKDKECTKNENNNYKEFIKNDKGNEKEESKNYKEFFKNNLNSYFTSNNEDLDDDILNKIYTFQHGHFDGGPHEQKANKLIGLTSKTYFADSLSYLNPPYKKDTLYLMTYADNYAIGYFKKNGFTTKITFKNWIHCIKDYDGGTMMQSKIIPELNYILKEEFIESLKLNLTKKLELMCDMNVYEGVDPRAQSIKGLENIQPDDLPSKCDFNHVIKFLLSDLQNHPSAWPFLQPVKQNEVPDYYIVIKSPMDLETMQRRMENNEYDTLDSFVNDFMLMISNCYVYNATGTQYYKCAQNLEDFFYKRKASFDRD